MSTNPFRRSSLKDPGGSNPRTTSDLAASITPVPLSVDTRVPSASQKHVNFASPPAIPISPVSYGSSPESTRFSPAFHPALLAQETPIDYSQAFQSDPFKQESEDDGGDSAIEQALHNAKNNTVIDVSPSNTLERTKEDAVKETLSRFASVPRRPSSNISTGGSGQNKLQKPALDVDAFKRLLLTGESGASIGKATVLSGAGITTQAISDNSSSADASSISQHSIFETVPTAVDETRRSSYETEAAEIESNRKSSIASASSGPEARKKPPPPKPRHGRPISEITNSAPPEDAIPAPEAETFTVSSQPNVAPESSGTDQNLSSSGRAEIRKTPPAPPLARRKSQNAHAGKPPLSRNSSSRNSITLDTDVPPSPSSGSKMAPPPPPMRRANTSTDRNHPMDLPPTAEERDGADVQVENLELTNTNFESRRPPAVKGISPISTGAPPPLPPPRRNRGPSRSSMDSQRPSLAALGMVGTTRSSGEFGRPGTSAESRNVSSSSQATDILADLAALQREVDAARGHA